MLRSAVTEGEGASRATTALIEALRATGETDEAWGLADRVWRHAPEAPLRLGLAELALETGRLAESLELSRPLAQDDMLGERAAVVEGSALLALGRFAEARRVLQRALPAAAAAVPWMEAVAALDGGRPRRVVAAPGDLRRCVGGRARAASGLARAIG
jgi:tetratricopeptide (TPR) repeat protein